MDFEEFENIALDAYDTLPDEIKKGLNMGVSVIPNVKPGKDGITYIMGEYYFDPMMGRGVRIFYGSFMTVMGDAPEPMLRHEIIKTIKHELRHHVEISAGVDYLGDEDRRKIARIKERFGMLPSDVEIRRRIIQRFLTSVLVLAVMLILIYIFVLRHIR